MVPIFQCSAKKRRRMAAICSGEIIGSPGIVKRIEKTPRPPTELADDPPGMGKESPPLPFGGHRNAQRRNSGKIEGSFGTLIRHAFYSSGLRRRRGQGLATPVGALPIAMIESSFGALLMPAAGGAELLNSGLKTASQPAITLSTVTRNADEEKSATSRSPAKPL